MTKRLGKIFAGLSGLTSSVEEITHPNVLYYSDFLSKDAPKTGKHSCKIYVTCETMRQIIDQIKIAIAKTPQVKLQEAITYSMNELQLAAKLNPQDLQTLTKVQHAIANFNQNISEAKDKAYVRFSDIKCFILVKDTTNASRSRDIIIGNKTHKYEETDAIISSINLTYKTLRIKKSGYSSLTVAVNSLCILDYADCKVPST
jgi:hypothetical protein